MQEKDLIRQLKAMREIKPRKEWVSLTKSQILGEEKAYTGKPSFSFPVFAWKWAFAPVMAVLLVIGFLAFSFFLPGTEIRVAEEPTEQPTKIAGASKPEKIAETVKKTEEMVQALSQVTENIKATPRLAEGAAGDIEKVEAEMVKLGQLLAVLQEKADSEKEQDLSGQVEYLISDLETRTLNEEQLELLESAKADAEAGDFERAIEKLLEI